MNNPIISSSEESISPKDKLWSKCLTYIKDRIQEQAFQTWFDGIFAISLNEEGITLQVPNQFHYEWLESKYRHLIDNALKEYAKHPMVVNYSVVISDKSIEEIPTFECPAADLLNQTSRRPACTDFSSMKNLSLLMHPPCAPIRCLSLRQNPELSAIKNENSKTHIFFCP